MEGKSTLMCTALFLGLFLSVSASNDTDSNSTTISTDQTGESANSTTPTSTTPSTTTTMNNSTAGTMTEVPTTSTKPPLPTLDNYEYLFQENETDFKKSLEICSTWGGDLVSIHSARENDFIKENVTVNYDGSAWIGLQLLQISYNWTDDTHFDFQNGLPEPDNSSDECYGFQKDGTWSNVSCDSLLQAYICRRPTGSMPTTTSPPSHHPLNPAGLSHTELILIICAVVLVGITFSLGAVWFIYKRKSRRRDIGAFSLLDEETASDFRVDDGYIDN